MARVSRRTRIALVTAIFAIGVPAGVHAYIAHRTQALADRITTIGGAPASIGSIDSSLLGTVRISDIDLGELAHVDTLEASVAGDEIRVEGPQLDLRVDPDGDSDLARVGRRLVSARGKTGHADGPSRKPRRIVVDGGSLVAHIPGIGELTAEDVEVVPDLGGVRVITGRVRIKGAAGPVQLAMQFPRAAAQLALPGAKFTRVLAVAGSGTAITEHSAIAFTDAIAGRLAPDGKLEVHASIDDAGSKRPIGATLQLATATRPLELALEGTRVPLAALGDLAPHAIGLAHARGSGSITLRRSSNSTVEPSTPSGTSTGSSSNGSSSSSTATGSITGSSATAIGPSYEVTVDGSIDDLALDHPRIAPAPVIVSGSIAGTVAISPDAVVLGPTTLRHGDLQLDASGWWRRGGATAAQLDVTLAQAPCARLFDAVPAPIRAPIDGLALAGEFGAHAKLAIDLAAPEGDGVALAIDGLDHCTVLAEPPGADVGTLAGVVDQAFPDGTHAKVGRGEPTYVTLRGLPGHVSGAFVSAEDGRFREHHGFDTTQIARSFEIDLREHRLARGGSTISQQLVKNAFLTQRRSLDRKLAEAILTWRLEKRLDKSQILERYLNIIELGPHVFGIGAAAKYWFATTPAKLTIRQSAFLAALTSAPTAMSARVRSAHGLDADSKARVDTILRAMRRDGAITQLEFDVAKSAPLAWATLEADGY